MKILKWIVLLLVVVSFHKLDAQVPQKLIFYAENTVQKKFAVDNSLQTYNIIYQNFFLIKADSLFSPASMEKAMDKTIPDKNATGLGVLDWEGYPYNVVIGYQKASDLEYQKWLKAYIDVIKYAKFLRPKMKWSFYAMPPRTYQQYIQIKEPWPWLDKFIPLLREVDFLAPGCYLWYAGADGIGNKFMDHYLDVYVRYSVELGVKLNKPVYPFVWNRYSDNSKMMDKNTFYQYVYRIITTLNFGKRVDGILWWNCEDYLYSTRAGNTYLTEEYKTITDRFAYQIQIFQTYLNAIKPLFVY